MPRLQHTDAGFLRYMQMSSVGLFIFVEGKQSDPYFYSNICATIPTLNCCFDIHTAREISGATGGKSVLISFYSFLRRRKSLVSSLGGKKTASIFFLDKDLDDLKRRQRRSLHVVYTQYYDVQNYIFMYGNILKGAASAASVNSARLKAELNDAQVWCRNKANLWRDWISLCICVLDNNIPCEANYNVKSKVQTRDCGPTDEKQLASCISAIAERSGMPVTVIKQRLVLSYKKVNMYFSKNQHHRLFKGKWFANILADEIDRIMDGRLYDKKCLPSRLVCSVATTLDFTEPWAEYFKKPIRDVAAKL